MKYYTNFDPARIRLFRPSPGLSFSAKANRIVSDREETFPRMMRRSSFFNAHPLGDIHQDDRRSLF